MLEIEQFRPCEGAIKFRSNYGSFESAWNECPRGDWMLWIAKKLDIDLKILTKTKAKCALTVRHLMKDQRSVDACEIALKFANGEATSSQLETARAAAWAADAAWTSNQKQTADICREILTNEVLTK